MRHIAIFGGTFDPVHLGHVGICEAIQSQFHFDSFYFLPCKIPTIKNPALASAEQRITMLRLALKNKPHFELDLREIARDTPSYMVDTLSSYRSEYPQDSITLIIGYDALLSLPNWHQWNKLLELANLLVVNREPFANQSMPQPIQQLLNTHQNDTVKSLFNSQAGKIVLFDAGYYDISSTEIKKRIKNKQDVDALLAKDVQEYIREWGLFQ